MDDRLFRLANFNVENLLHPGVKFARNPNEPSYGKADYDEKIGWIVGILREGGAHLVGFQELFSDVAFQDVASRAELTYTYAPDIKEGKNIDENGATGPFVGLASRFEIKSAESILDFPTEASAIRLELKEGSAHTATLPVTRFQRPVIRAEVALRHDLTATVFVAHLKSKRPQILKGEDPKSALTQTIGNTRSLVLRAAESVALRALVLKELKDTKTPVIVFGDLNDDLNAVTTQNIAGEEPFFLLDSELKKAFWDRLLYSVHDLEEAQSYRNVSYTHIYNGRYELLDHIFVSQELVAANPERVATVRGTRIFNDHLKDERHFRQEPGRGPSRRSDHGIPVTEIWWR